MNGKRYNILNAEVIVPLKYLSNFCRSLDLLLANCKIELDVKWTKHCAISEISRTLAVPAKPIANPSVPVVAATAIISANFE